MDKQAAACRLWARTLPVWRSNSVIWEHRVCMHWPSFLPPLPRPQQEYGDSNCTLFGGFLCFPCSSTARELRKSRALLPFDFFFCLFFSFFGSSIPRDLRKISILEVSGICSFLSYGFRVAFLLHHFLLFILKKMNKYNTFETSARPAVITRTHAREHTPCDFRHVVVLSNFLIQTSTIAPTHTSMSLQGL